MSFHHGPFKEGKAYGLLGMAEDRNPYARAIRERGTEDFAAWSADGPLPSVFREYANDWGLGWIQGNAILRRTCPVHGETPVPDWGSTLVPCCSRMGEPPR